MPWELLITSTLEKPEETFYLAICRSLAMLHTSNWLCFPVQAFPTNTNILRCSPSLVSNCPHYTRLPKVFPPHPQAALGHVLLQAREGAVRTGRKDKARQHNTAQSKSTRGNTRQGKREHHLRPDRVTGFDGNGQHVNISG